MVSELVGDEPDDTDDVRVAVRVPVAKALGVVDSAMEGDPVELADCVPDGLPVDVAVAKGVRGGVGG